MRILLISVALILAVLVAGVVWIGGPQGPSLEDVVHLQTPQILEMDSQRVLVVVAEGNPNVEGPEAFGLLMKTYFSLDGVPKWGAELKPPRARWPSDPDTPLDEWVGYYAMPVPNDVSIDVSNRTEDGLSVELATWEYGEVAQILHVGRYDQEAADIARLKAFIRGKGYEINGLHEEEYLKGPGFLFRGDPDEYLTLLRYPVKKVEQS
jgi:effector-binding domain-containing protein